MNPDQEKQLKKYKTHLEKVQIDPNLPIADILSEINDNLKALVDKEEKEIEIPEPKDFPTEMNVKIEGIETVTLKGEKGDTPTSKDLIELIKPLIPLPIKPKDGYTPIKGKDYFDGKDGISPDLDTVAYEASKIVENKLTPLIPKIEDIEKDLPKLGMEIRNALELLKGDERLDVKSIKGLQENFDKFNLFMQRPVSMASIAGRDIIKDIDISASLDGVTKTFNIQAIWNVISVVLSSFPTVLRKNIDYTYTPTSITFSTGIDASTSLAIGQTCILTVVVS